MTSRAAPSAARQMVLDLTRAPSFDPDDFLVSPANADAHALVMAWPDWPSRTLLLIGPSGAGKSHLAAIWAGRVGARPLAADALGGFEGEEPPVSLIENADRGEVAEHAMFHLLNMIEERRGWLLMTARTPPDRWGLHTADLLSRLRRAPIAEIADTDEVLLRAVLVKLFADRQIRIEEDVVAYAARHCEQSLDAASRFVAAVDEAALAEGRRVTRPLAVRTLAALSAPTESIATAQGPT